MVVKAKYEPGYGIVSGHVGLEEPMGVVVGTNHAQGMGILFLHEVARRHVEAQHHMMAHLAAVHEHVGKGIAVLIGVLPFLIENLHNN